MEVCKRSLGRERGRGGWGVSQDLWKWLFLGFFSLSLARHGPDELVCSGIRNRRI